MNILIKIWNWLNGKKTVIGLALMGIATFIQVIVIGKWEASADWLPKLVETLSYLGAILTGGGLLHKSSKALTGGNA